jgi:hypothetical protein
LKKSATQRRQLSLGGVFRILGRAIFTVEAPKPPVYPSQRETRPYRALRRAFALRERLGNRWGIGDPVFTPKHLHWRTFESFIKKLSTAEGIVDSYTNFLAQRYADLEKGSP